MGPHDQDLLDRTDAGARQPPRWWHARGGIGRRLLVLMVAFSVAVTLLLTALQLYLNHRREMRAIDARLAEIGVSYGDSLAAGLWNLDQPQLELQLQGILRLPDIQGVELRESGTLHRPLVLRMGRSGGNALGREYPIVYRHQDHQRPVGTLRVEATLQPLRERLASRARTSLLTQAVQTFLVALFLLYIVHRLITRHLIEIAAFVSRFDLRRAERPLALERTAPRRPDELGRVVDSFNQMSVYLRRAYADLEQANRDLENGLSLRRSYEERLERQAHYDSLTGLANRVLLVDRLHFALRRAERVGTPCALLCIDLDRFKNINDTLGHAAGDELLKEAGSRLAGCVRESDTLARLGGDEFAVIAAVESEEAPARLAARVLNAFAAPFSIGGHNHHVTASVGITLFPADGDDAHLLLRNAELAMYKAKESGRNRQQRFEERFNQALSEQMSLEERLRGAVANQELVLHYQPIVALDARRVVAYEALLRWRMAPGELCPPDRFIPRAEELGIINEFGRWVLDAACADAAQTCALRVAVNVSPRQLQESGFADFVDERVRHYGLRPEQVELEITERVVMDDSPATEANLRLLCAMGVRLSIDDFGTGYSSLAYLQKYPFHTLKIDRSFVAAALLQPSAARLVETIVAMGHALGMEVIAEGVETEEQLAFLTTIGCELGQGYLFGRPAPRATTQTGQTEALAQPA